MANPTTIQVAKIVPFIQNAADICGIIFQLATTAQHNKAVCKALAERVKVKQQWLEQEAPSGKCQKAFEKYISVLKEIREYIVELRAPGPFSSRFLEKLRKKLGHMINKGVGPTRKEIEEAEINYEDFRDNETEKNKPVYRGFPQQIQKKLFVPNGEYVALKRLGKVNKIKKENLDNNIYKQMVLFSNFQSCTSIEKFYGITIESNFLYLATKWAEFGDLETYLYNNPGIKWKRKAKFVASISNALSWCHSRDILHHDIRYHSILLDDNLTPKLSNFAMSRFSLIGAVILISSLTPGTRWAAPQRLKSAPYSKQMDFYSFGIMMWGIAAQALPFTDISSINEVALAIFAGSRPSPIPLDAPADYCSLTESAWQEVAIRRPTMQFLAELGIQALRSNSPLPGVENSEAINETSLIKMTFANSKAEIDVQISELPAVKPRDQLPDWEHLEEMIKENRQINEVMPFIEVHAKQKNFFAQFYAGKFLYEGGSGVERDEDQALVYLKQAADAQLQPGRRRLIARAQFMYAHACLKGSSYDQTAGMHFLRRATRNQEPRAYLLYAQILLDGLHAQPIDLDGAETFLKKYMAANPPEMKNKHVKGKFDNLMKRVQVYKKRQS
ncbi:hypothetical protein G9A89_001607 [Geosiphon pyriformis]|nr:hypothetical protein G9A89_001607 [Geosiphon pyriformis]